LVLVRNPFGLVFTLLLGSVLLLVVLRVPRASQTVVILLAVQLALSVFSRSDYLFTRTALTVAGPMPSDVAVMAAALFLPYWFWGVACGVLSVIFLLLGVKFFFRPLWKPDSASSPVHCPFGIGRIRMLRHLLISGSLTVTPEPAYSGKLTSRSLNP